MEPCDKRQKVVKRSLDGQKSELFRCMNDKSGLKGQEVTEAVCSRCPVRAIFKKEPPCKDPKAQRVEAKESVPKVTTQEMIDVTDEDVRAMIEEAGMDVSDIEKAQKQEAGMPPPNYPPLSIQIWNYKEALLKWNKAGRPTRTPEEVETLHSQFCSRCDWYDPEQKRCRGCGCRVTSGGLAVFNKLKMKTEKCPKGLF